MKSAFTFGRRSYPSMFTAILKNFQQNFLKPTWSVYYFERHIEIDADEHGPMRWKWSQNLWEDAKKWAEVEQISIAAQKDVWLMELKQLRGIKLTATCICGHKIRMFVIKKTNTSAFFINCPIGSNCWNIPDKPHIAYATGTQNLSLPPLPWK
jgi:hypothetical protein